jgi:hypothetical protein
MELAPIARGLQATGTAIQRAQTRFDERAAQTVADSLAAADPDTPTDSAQLTSDVVGLKTDSIVNSILFSVFKAQADQSKQLADLVTPRD